MGRNVDTSMGPLTPAVFHILLTLADGERHGYAIMQEIAARTAGRLAIGPGTLYGSIKRLLADGLIVEAEARPDLALDDERRRYYRLTDVGRRVAVTEDQVYRVVQTSACFGVCILDRTQSNTTHDVLLGQGFCVLAERLAMNGPG